MSAALTTGATVAANAEHHPAQIADAVESVITNPREAGFDLTVGAHLPPVIGRVSVQSSRVEGPSERSVVFEAHTVPVRRPWAEKFSADPAAWRPLSGGELDALVTVTQAAEKAGAAITSITVQGHASDEALKKGQGRDANPGLGIADKRNVELADTRAHAAGPTAQQTVEKVTGYGVPVRYAPAKEHVDPSQATEIIATAKELDVTPRALVETYNRSPKVLPNSVRNELDGLADDRRVDVTLNTVTAVPPVLKAASTDLTVVPLGVPVFERTSTDATPPDVPAPVYAVPNYPQAATKPVSQYVPPVAHRQIQPRNYNFHNAPGRDGGRMSRSSGGNRSMKRA